MKLYDVAPSPNCRKVRVIARELGLPLEICAIDLARAKEPAYLAQNPAGKVPTLVDDDGFVLWESGAILIYLAEKKPERGLWPSAPQARADVLRWMFFLATHLQPWLSVLGQERLIKPRTGLPADPASIALAERELGRFLPLVNAQLDGREYLAGDYSIADIAVGCGLENCEARGVSLDGYPHLGAWRERLRQRPAWHDPRA
jgi:glutathione S-transferase